MSFIPINLGEKNKKAPFSKTMRLLTAKGKDGSPASASGKMRSENQPIHFPIVGIGASAGGLAAFEAFFSGMPTYTEPGMAFVLVQHLAPDHQNILTGLIQRYTPMQVSEVEDGMQVKINCIYIIPPGRDMTFQDGTLRLHEPSAPRGQQLPIDSFFRSLARDQHERAIAIVLSGTGSDGTLGVRAIKGEGGMTMAQAPDSTEYDGMPRSAIATGLIDFQLPPAEMPAQLMAYVAHAFSNHSQTSLVQLPTAVNARQAISPHASDRTQPQLFEKRAGPGKLTLRELTERTLLQLAAPTGALVNGRGDILYLHGRTGMYLETNLGEAAVNNILLMAREGLRDELTSALNRVTTSGEVVRRNGLRVNANGVFITVNLTIMKVVTGPTPTPEAPLYLIFLEEVAHLQPGKSD